MTHGSCQGFEFEGWLRFFQMFSLEFAQDVGEVIPFDEVSPTTRGINDDRWRHAIEPSKTPGAVGSLSGTLNIDLHRILCEAVFGVWTKNEQ